MSDIHHEYSGEFLNGFPYSKQVRQDFIEAVDKSRFVASGYKIPSESGLYNVYPVDIDYMLYNFENGRYLTRKLTREKQLGRDIFSSEHNLPEAVTEIERILWGENTKENDETIEDLLRNGQEVPGVIDSTGVVVSGNRRLRLLHEIKRRRHAGHPSVEGISQERLDELANFKAVIIDRELTPREINDYESRLQYGEKRKLDYDPIEKYFIVRRLKDDDKWSDDKIIDNNKEMPMLRSAKDVAKFIRICGLMEEYLKTIESPGIYTLLKDAEDMFRQLDESLEKIKNGALPTMRPTGNIDLELLKFKQVFFFVIRDRDTISGKKYYRNLVKLYASDPLAWSTLHGTVQQVQTEATIASVSIPSVASTTDTIKAKEVRWKSSVGNTVETVLKKSLNTFERDQLINEPTDMLSEMHKDAVKISIRLMGVDGAAIVRESSADIREILDKLEAELNHIRNRLDV